MNRSSPLIFVDTNIFLDLYRAIPEDVSTKLMARLQKQPDIFITTHQVKMEFLKNRLSELKKIYNSLALPDNSKANIAPMFPKQEKKRIGW